MARSQSFRTGFCLAGFSAAVHVDVNLLGKVPSQLLGHYLLHISFSSGTFSKVCAGRQPLPLYHYSATAKKFSSWTHEATLLVYKRGKVWGKCSGIKLDIFQLFCSSLSSKSTCKSAASMRRECQINEVAINNVQQSQSPKITKM